MAIIKSFREFLSESATADLYHATRYDFALNILESGSLTARTPIIHMGGQRGVSLTRNYRFAYTWRRDVIFVFDQAKIRNNSKVKPIDYFKTWNNLGNAMLAHDQYEEFVYSDIDLNKCLKSINFIMRVDIPRDNNVASWESEDQESSAYELITFLQEHTKFGSMLNKIVPRNMAKYYISGETILDDKLRYAWVKRNAK